MNNINNDIINNNDINSIVASEIIFRYVHEINISVKICRDIFLMSLYKISSFWIININHIYAHSFYKVEKSKKIMCLCLFLICHY